MRPSPTAKASFARDLEASLPAGDRAMTHSAMTPMVSATIDTAALRHNLQVLRQWAPRSRVMAVIKANAYGHGLVAVARALESADAFAVARVDEGMILRQAGIGTRTVLLEGVFDAGQLAAAAAAGFELVVHTAEQIELLRGAPPGATFKIWLKLDTGMNRLGFKGPAFDAAHAALAQVVSLAATRSSKLDRTPDRPWSDWLIACFLLRSKSGSRAGRDSPRQKR